MAVVARGERGLRHRPRNADRGIVPRDADLARRVVQVGALVFDLCDGADDTESVGKSRRDEALLEIRCGQTDADPATERRRAAADVDGDVEDLSLDDPDQLSLWPPKLQVQAAKCAADRSRMVVLDERGNDAVL